MKSSNLQWFFFLFQERREDARFWRRKAIELEEQKRWAQGPSGVSTTDNPYRSVEKARPNSAIEVKKMVNTPPSFNLSPRPASSCLPESTAGGLATIFSLLKNLFACIPGKNIKWNIWSKRGFFTVRLTTWESKGRPSQTSTVSPETCFHCSKVTIALVTIPCSEGGSVGHVVMDLQTIPRDGWPGQDPTIESSPPKWAMSTNSVNTVVENPNFNTPTSTAASDGGSTHRRQRRGSYTLDQPSPVLLAYLRYGH